LGVEKLVTYASLVRPALLVLAPLGAGVLARRTGALRPLFRLIRALVLWAVLPALVFGSVAVKHADIFSLGGGAVLALVGLGATAATSAVLTHITKMGGEESIAVFINSSFMNYTFLGLAVVAVVNVDWLGAASAYAVTMGVIHLTVGVVLASGGSGKRMGPREVVLSVLTFPAAFALIAAMLFVGFDVSFPIAAQEWVDKLADPEVILMLLTAGYQMPLVDPRKYLSQISMVGAIRFLVCPLVTFAAIMLLGFERSGPAAGASMLLSVMPPGVFNLILAQNFGLDLRLHGAIVFYLTVISLFVAVPLIVFLWILP